MAEDVTIPSGFKIVDDAPSVGIPEGFKVIEQEQSQSNPSVGDYIMSGASGLQDTLTFGFDDEINAAARSLMNRGLSYEQALSQARQLKGEMQQQAPFTYGAGQVGGAIAPAAAITKGLQKVGINALQSNPIKSAIGIGAAEGGLYGYGSGDSGAGNRAESATEMGLYGGIGGAVGASGAKLLGRAGNSLLERVKGLFPEKPTLPTTISPSDIIEQVSAQEVAAPISADTTGRAINKVRSVLESDLGGNMDMVLDAYKKGDVSLAELYGSRSRSLAKGAAQYPSGQEGAEKFFNQKVGGSYERILDKIKTDVTDLDAYFTSAEDLVNAGRSKASGLYYDAYQNTADVDIVPEVAQAIAKAKKKFPSELKDLPDNNVKVLDYAKRVLDDDISKAQRKGEGNFARSRTQIKNDFVDRMKEQVPSYKEALGVSGDYLSIKSAMESGQGALRLSSDEVANTFKGLTDPEKVAFKNGMGKAIRDEIGKVNEGANPYARILGSPEKKKKVMAVLSPKQFDALNRTLKAEDRLFKMRNEVLGGSPTASKLEAKNMIGTTADGVDNIMQIPRKTAVGAIKMFFDGLNDKTAGKVSEILYETDPQKKLNILDALGKTKEFTPQERKIVKETYFQVMPTFDVTRTMGAGVGGLSTPAITNEE